MLTVKLFVDCNEYVSVQSSSIMYRFDYLVLLVLGQTLWGLATPLFVWLNPTGREVLERVQGRVGYMFSR